jgi:hypothetical protein
VGHEPTRGFVGVGEHLRGPAPAQDGVAAQNEM